MSRCLFAVVGALALAAGYQSQTLLEHAVEQDDAEAIRREIKARPEGLDQRHAHSGQTPLMFAVLTGKEKAVKALLEAGADTTIAEMDGYTPMHGAAFQGRGKIAKMLIDHGLDPNPMHKDGFTPLHRACWGRTPRHAEVVRVILEAGVPPNFKAGNGHTPLQLTQSDEARIVLLEFHRKQGLSPMATDPVPAHLRNNKFGHTEPREREIKTEL